MRYSPEGKATIRMMYSYAKLPDETLFAYSGLREDNTVKVLVERPVDGGFDSAVCMLPAHEWTDVKGFSSEELADLQDFVRDNAPLIMRLAGEAVKAYA